MAQAGAQQSIKTLVLAFAQNNALSLFVARHASCKSMMRPTEGYGRKST
jgi:hypothetical protein